MKNLRPVAELRATLCGAEYRYLLYESDCPGPPGLRLCYSLEIRGEGQARLFPDLARELPAALSILERFAAGGVPLSTADEILEDIFS